MCSSDSHGSAECARSIVPWNPMTTERIRKQSSRFARNCQQLCERFQIRMHRQPRATASHRFNCLTTNCNIHENTNLIRYASDGVEDMVRGSDRLGVMTDGSHTEQTLICVFWGGWGWMNRPNDRGADLPVQSSRCVMFGCRIGRRC
jgi:hypothetical protein